jgi:hypothetical protein
MTKPDFILKINQLRKANKNKWFSWTGVVDGKNVKVKCYNTWLQILNVDGLQHNTVMDISVAEFNTTLERI